MSAYKRDRYGGWLGGLQWAKDKLVGMPSERQRVLRGGREVYIKQMDLVISRVADIVGASWARRRRGSRKGKARSAAYVKPPEGPRRRSAPRRRSRSAAVRRARGRRRREAGRAGAAWPSKYVEARDGRRRADRGAPGGEQGLWDKAKDAIGGAIETILKLKDMLLGVLARAAGAIGKIIKDPIGFLGNFVNAVKARHRRLRRAHRGPPQAGLQGLAVRRAGRGRHPAAREVRPARASSSSSCRSSA